MTAIAPNTAARSYRTHFLVVAALVLAGLAYVWFSPSAADERRLEGLQLDPTLVIPELAGETPERISIDTSVARRSWDGSWSITEHRERYALTSRRVNRYAEDLYDHVAASTWSITAVRCREDQFVLTARQPFDGDWATLEITARAVGANGEMTVRSAVSAAAGTSLVVDGELLDADIDCPEVS